MVNVLSKKILGPVHVDIQSDKLDYLKKSKADFFQNYYIKSKHDEQNYVKFGFGVDLLNLMASALRDGKNLFIYLGI